MFRQLKTAGLHAILIGPFPRTSKARTILCWCLFALAGCGGGGGGGGDGSAPPAVRLTHPATVTVAGTVRSYTLYVPPNFRPNSSALVLVLHGMTINGPVFEDNTQMTAKAQQEGFAIAYPLADRWTQPTGSFQDWAYFFVDTFAVSPPPDDILFLRTLINTLQVSVNPDPKRIYVAGFSNGANMTHRVAVELSDLVAAVGAVDGAMYISLPPVPPMPSTLTPISVLTLQSELTPADGGTQLCTAIYRASADQAFAYWTGPSANSCAMFSTADNFCSGPTRAVYKTASNCLNNVEVRSYVLLGGVHTWYGSPMDNPTRVPYNPAFNATIGTTTNDILWNFFLTHPKP